MEVTHTIGRRKTSVARVYMNSGSGKITVNDKDYKTYFPTLPLQYQIHHALETVGSMGAYDIRATVEGGGISGQAESIKLAIARALVKINPEHKTTLKAKGLMTRDPRMVERKKPGQKKARKRFQFSKR